LNKWKKAIASGMTAALIASLFTIVAASTALAAVTVGSAGTVPRGGTSTGTVTFTFTESAAACLVNPLPASPDLTVTLTTAGVTFSGTPVVAAPGSLGATASASGTLLTINLTGSDTLNVETLTITGLSLAATTTATLGDVTATVAGDAATVACFTSGPQTATGVVGVGVGTGSTSIVINVDNCAFEVTDTTDLQPGALVFGTGGTAETRNITAVSAVGVPGPGQQTLTIQATTIAHPVDQIVSQAGVLTCSTVLLTGLGTVRDSLIYNAPASVPLLFPGENNQLAANLTATERTLGFLSVGTTVTFTITTAGVTFSSAAPNLPLLTATSTLAFGALTMSADHTSVTATVTTASAAAATLTLSNIHYDVASTVPSGSLVNVTLALSGSKTVVPTSRANAQVGRVFNATAATLPSVNIGQNNQATGLISIVEVTAGAFTDGSGSNNVFEICPDGTASFSLPGPWAKVTTTDVGALRLRDGSGASATNIVAGTADPNAPGCFYWTVWTKSTVASTIQIGNSTFSSGPLVNVFVTAPAGPLNANLSAGTLGTAPPVGRIMTVQVSLPIANRVFASQVSVTAVSQPVIAAGAVHALAGDILIQENGNGQLKNGTTICVDIVPNAQTNVIQDVYFSSLNTADLPLATATGGVVIGAVSFSTVGCLPSTLPVGTLFHSFRFGVTQQSTTGTGKVNISNIHYNVVNDADTGPVQVNVYGFSVGTNIDFQRIISNASIGVPAPGKAATRLGVTQVGAFTTSTKVQKVGKYVTYRFDFGVAAAGKAVQIWGATKTGNDWSAFTVVTTRTANASGVVYYYIRQNSATWKSYRGMWVTGGAFTPARQARWIR
jgi:hypothetical protein